MDTFLVLSGTTASYVPVLTTVTVGTGLALAVPAPQIPFQSLLKVIFFFFLGNVFSLPSRQSGSLTQGCGGGQESYRRGVD